MLDFANHLPSVLILILREWDDATGSIDPMS